jgi:hypothetical protein
MKDYLLLFRGGASTAKEQQSAEEWQAHMQKWVQWMKGLSEEGKLVGAQPLTNGGKTITGSKKMVTDGPYMEGKELVGGYLICKVATLEEATEISKGCPVLEFENGSVEVREIQEMKMN